MEKIAEDYAITSESERLIHLDKKIMFELFGYQFKKSLESVGFSIIVNQYKKEEDVGFSNEIIHTKIRCQKHQ